MSHTVAPPPAQSPESSELALRLVRLLRRPLDRFLAIETASSIVLIIAAAIAFGLASSPWHHAYEAFWQTPLGLRIGDHVLERPLEWVVNDGLMVVFFFVVGLEIRRETHHGELSEWRRAALPALAAAFGMLGPALVYLALAGGVAHRGWGVPTATDIAFALGVLGMLGKRVPPALRVLLLALAVIDDLGAILVIAVFYSGAIDPRGLLVAAAGLAWVVAQRSAGVRAKWAYVPPGLLAWAGTYAAGVHPTIAGVALGLLTPVTPWLGTSGVTREAPEVVARLDVLGREHHADPHAIQAALRDLDHLRREATSPAESLIEALHPWVAFAIMPLFALANAGVSLSGLDLGGTRGTVAVATGVGLVVGKLAGVLFGVGIARVSGLGTLPRGVTPAHLVVLGLVAGVGFTMALFVAALAFDDAHVLAAAKLGVLVGSVTSGLLALIAGRALLPAAPEVAPDGQASVEGARTADEAESSTEL